MCHSCNCRVFSDIQCDRNQALERELDREVSLTREKGDVYEKCMRGVVWAATEFHLIRFDINSPLFWSLFVRYSAVGWLRLVGSLKLQVSFETESYKKRQYSAKETCNFKEPANRRHPIAGHPYRKCVL